LPAAVAGCAVAIGGYIYHQRLAFRHDFAKQNDERTKEGLPPLNWCDELYKHDKSWFAEDDACKDQPEPARHPSN
jgi:hypothetical protein